MTESGYWVYGLSVEDIDYTLDLATRLVASHVAAYDARATRVRAENPEQADDILDDFAHYTHVEAGYVWHYSLWRLQAVFEGLLVHHFLKGRKVSNRGGVGKKLDAMISAGYEVRPADREALLAWAQLRNSLSHAPPERFRPGSLCEADVIEYAGLLRRLCSGWHASGVAGSLPGQ